MLKTLRWIFLALFFNFLSAAPLWAQAMSADNSAHADQGASHAATGDAHGAAGKADAHGGSHGGHGEGHKPGVFDAHQGTWVNPLARGIFGKDKPTVTQTPEKEPLTTPHDSVKYDFLVLAICLFALLAVMGVMAGKNAKIRPEGKPNSLTNAVEAAVEGFHDYVVGIMGHDLARKYSPLIATYFFAILFMNYAGLVPGLMAPTANPNVPIALAIVAFFATHIIAIKETGIKSWFLHLVGEPLWLVPLNLPLHIIGEFIKPLSLAVRLLGNVFGEETVVLKLAALGMGIVGITTLGDIPMFSSIPILKDIAFPGVPINLLMMFLGMLFGALQALVFSTLLAIYISIFSTHSDGHEAHDHHDVEHTHVHGHDEIIVQPKEVPVA
ncbi:MAG TPA: F0F1 ATP synthase subunit A [Abditibacteriaceae bacterium]|jgi:F-type H+-transporting ATPase subunit a